jgi:hypothetical protein
MDHSHTVPQAMSWAFTILVNTIEHLRKQIMRLYLYKKFGMRKWLLVVHQARMMTTMMKMLVTTSTRKGTPARVEELNKVTAIRLGKTMKTVKPKTNLQNEEEEVDQKAHLKQPNVQSQANSGS